MSSVRPLHRLTHLRVVVHFRIYGRDEDCGRAFDFEGAAAALVAPLPCLRYIFVATNGCVSDWDGDKQSWEERERWHLPHAWRVADPGTSGWGLVELHDEVAQTIIRKEELVLSEADQASLGFLLMMRVYNG